MALRAGLMSVPMVTVILMPPHQRVRRGELKRAGESSRFGIGARTHHTWPGKPNPMRAGNQMPADEPLRAAASRYEPLFRDLISRLV